MLLLLFLLSISVFFLFNILPGDPARLTCGKACTPVIIEQNRHRLGLDEPLDDLPIRQLGHATLLTRAAARGRDRT